MELVGILRSLLRRPILVVIGALAAIAIGVLAGGGKTEETGTASARLVMDTARSQLIYQNPSGADTLGWRAILLADLAGSRELRDRIASEVGIRRNELVVVHPELAVPAIPATLPNRAAEVAKVVSEKYILTVRFDEPLPIISLKAEAPDRGAAVSLVEAAAGALKDTGTSGVVTPDVLGLVVEDVGPVRSKAIVDRPQPLLGVAIAVVLFGFWCAAVALLPHLRGTWWRLVSGQRPRAA